MVSAPEDAPVIHGRRSESGIVASPCRYRVIWQGRQPKKVHPGTRKDLRGGTRISGRIGEVRKANAEEERIAGGNDAEREHGRKEKAEQNRHGHRLEERAAAQPERNEAACGRRWRRHEWAVRSKWKKRNSRAASVALGLLQVEVHVDETLREREAVGVRLDVLGTVEQVGLAGANPVDKRSLRTRSFRRLPPPMGSQARS